VSSHVSAAVIQGTSAASGNSKLRLGAKIASAALGRSLGSVSLEGERIAAEKLTGSSMMLRGMIRGRNKALSSLAFSMSASGKLNSDGSASQPVGAFSQTSATFNSLSSAVTTGQSGAGGSSSGASGSSVSAGGQFPDSTRSAVSISPPFSGENLFPFSPLPPVFHPDFDGQHLNPNYASVAVPSVRNTESGGVGRLSAFDPNNIQQSAPTAGPSVSPSDPIAAALQAILHPDQ